MGHNSILHGGLHTAFHTKKSYGRKLQFILVITHAKVVQWRWVFTQRQEPTLRDCLCPGKTQQFLYKTTAAEAFNRTCKSVFRNLGSRDSSVGIATRYGLNDLGIESRWGRDFPPPFTPALGPTQLPVKWVLCFFPGGKAAGAWR
jgi:hypothetical protein